MLNTCRKVIVGIVLTGALIFPGTQPVYAWDIGNVLVKSAVDYANLKKELNYYNTTGSNELGEYLRSKNGVDDDQAKNEQLNLIMTNLTAAIAKKEKIDPSYKYFVNQHKDFNAFCALGHNVSVNTGLFDILNNDEDEISFVLAHEMVHGQRNHSINAVDKSVPINILQKVISQDGTSQGSAMLSNIAGNYLIAKQATLPDEWEADNIGFSYATEAGYNPGAGAAIWAKILEKYGDNHRNFFGDIMSPNDHPTNSQRVNNYAKKLTEYSNGNVAYDSKTSYIIVKNKPWFKVTKSTTKSANERGYLIAGKLARIFHNSTVEPATVVDGNVMIGDYEVVSPNETDGTPENIAQKLNQNLGLAN